MTELKRYIIVNSGFEALLQDQIHGINKLIAPLMKLIIKVNFGASTLLNTIIFSINSVEYSVHTQLPRVSTIWGDAKLETGDNVGKNNIPCCFKLLPTNLKKKKKRRKEEKEKKNRLAHHSYYYLYDKSSNKLLILLYMKEIISRNALII